jgi:predicted O-methyltransferase YrrM
LAHIADELRTDYESYVRNVSTADMAVSLETACLLRLLCEGLEPQRVLDLGSGFSSFTLRSYQPARGRPAICSVDDDPEWLQRTRDYLDEQGLPTDDLWIWSDFQSSDHAPFDLVFYDLGRMPLRRRALRQALSLGRGGSVLLDDMHKHEYAQEAYSTLAGLGCTWFNLRALTLDERGRFSVLVTNIRSAET